MTRFRIVPTRMISSAHVVRALQELGFPDVERFDEPEPLLNWLGKVTPARGHVVLRRRYIGATGDDLGFARNAAGTYDAVLSEIHLYRFNKKWLAHLEDRHDALMAADAGLASPPTVRPLVASMPAAPPPLVAAEASTRPTSLGQERDRLGRGVEAVMGRIQAESKRGGTVAKLILAIPFLIWLAAFLADPGSDTAAGFACVIVAWCGGAVVWAVMRAYSIAKAGALEFQRRFPADSAERAAALSRFDALSSSGDLRRRAQIRKMLSMTGSTLGAHGERPARKR